MIDHISKHTKGNRVDYTVYYKNGRRFRYRENDSLPMTVVELLINGECKTVYTETGKSEYFS